MRIYMLQVSTNALADTIWRDRLMLLYGQLHGDRLTHAIGILIIEGIIYTETVHA